MREKSIGMEMDGMTSFESGFRLDAFCYCLATAGSLSAHAILGNYVFVLHSLGLVGAQDHEAHRRAQGRMLLRMSQKEQPAPSFL